MMVCDKMMYVVTALPPTNRKAAAKVGDEHTNQGIDDEIVGDALMSSVVSSEHDLVLPDVSCILQLEIKSGDVPRTTREGLQM